MAGEWPLVGRELELGLINDLLRSRERNGAVLAGPAGVGKTRLALECLADAARAGLPTAHASVTRSAAHLPFGALAPLLPAAETTTGGALSDEAEFLRQCCVALAERDVALLAAAGRSNKEIAAELYPSLRTVENYVHRAYEKLGVSGRPELAEALKA